LHLLLLVLSLLLLLLLRLLHLLLLLLLWWSRPCAPCLHQFCCAPQDQAHPPG
jgi:hypothetical protein